PVAMIPFGKRPKKLPAVLSSAEVNKLLSCVKCHKHHAFLLTQYAAGKGSALDPVRATARSFKSAHDVRCRFRWNCDF
ncbi:MAG TPA: hypothetical protein PLR25_02635, partial [Planctomycetaceae bacterium]|nr:hypothetical protein [Planctomycetaceae bacterium]